MKFPIKEIASLLQGEIIGSKDVVIDNVSTLENANEGCLSFLSNPKYENHIYETNASAVLVKSDFEPAKEISTTLIKVKDPYLSFSILLDEYDKLISYQKEGIEEPSFIGKGSSTGEKIYRGAFSFIGENVTIGKNVKIFPHVYVGDEVMIGDNTILHSGVKIYANTRMGTNCHIHAGAVIGSDGFGFAPQKDGTYKKIPQLGNVILEDNVDIGANTVVDCATLESTIIKKGAKLDNLIQIAHNVVIGENTVIAGQTGISGSTKIGKNCILAGQVGIAGHVDIADKVTIGAQAGITKSITTEGQILLGSPAIYVGDFRRSITIFKKLPELQEKLLRLEAKVKNFQEE
jgi:UDP-3-O-[3-hydroxymyristoyl] glucosamine N-acyltransferase